MLAGICHTILGSDSEVSHIENRYVKQLGNRIFLILFAKWTGSGQQPKNSYPYG